MIEIPPSEFDKAAPLFSAIHHNVAIVHSVLERNSAGRIFVDACDAPSLALLYAEGAFFYLTGDEKAAIPGDEWVNLIFDRLLPQMKEPELVLFTFSAGMHTKLGELLDTRGAIQIRRKNFRFNPARFQSLPDWRKALPEGYSMHLVDGELAERFPRFLPLTSSTSHRFGVCLQYGSEIISECSSVFVGKNEAEIDIHTGESYRGKGMAALTACAFIEECLLRGFTPAWSCWPERKASAALAVKLGFDELPDVPAYFWAKKM